MVIVDAGDMAIQDVVVRLTRPLESAANSVPGAKRVVSKTSRGSAEVSVDFDWGTDLFQAYARLNAAIAQVRSSLPSEADIEVEWVNPSSFPILGYSMVSSGHSPRELREIATLTVAPYLSRLDGVYRVMAQGGEVREYQVLVDPNALAAAGITPQQVSAALAETNLIRSVGRLSRLQQSYLVIATAQIDRLDDILDVVVATHAGVPVPVRVRDVAEVREGDREIEEVTTADGHEAVLVSVLKQQGASTAAVSAEVRAALVELQASNAVPSDITFTAFYDEADLLEDSNNSLRDAILIGAVLGILVLWFFLASLRSTLVVVLCLPMTVLISLLVLKLLHETLNIMTLGGLAVGLGLIIDDVVVTMENIFRHAEGTQAPRAAAIAGTTEILKPMLGSSLASIAVFVPLAFLPGITGAFFAPLSITLTILLVVSVVLAVTVVPLVSARLIRTRGVADPGAGGLFQHVHDGLYPAILRRAIRAPWLVVAMALALVAVAVGVFLRLPTGFMPEMDEGAFVIDYLAPDGTTLEDTDRLCRSVEDEIRRTPEVASYARRTGLELGFFATDPNRGDISVKLKPRGKRERSMGEVMEDVLDRCERRLPALTLEVVAPLADRVADIAGEPSAIEVKVFGDEPEVLNRLAEQIS